MKQLYTAGTDDKEAAWVLQPHDLSDGTVAAHPRRGEDVTLEVRLDFGDEGLVIPKCGEMLNTCGADEVKG